MAKRKDRFVVGFPKAKESVIWGKNTNNAKDVVTRYAYPLTFTDAKKVITDFTTTSDKVVYELVPVVTKARKKVR